MNDPKAIQNLLIINIGETDHFPLPAPEAIIQRCSVKKVFLEISQSSQENTCPRVSFLDLDYTPSFCRVKFNSFNLYKKVANNLI